MKIVTKMKVTTLGVVCSECGGTIADKRLLDDARNARWKCPLCGAAHISLNDEARLARYTESGADEAPEEEAEESCFIDHIGEGRLQQMREEFQKRKTL